MLFYHFGEGGFVVTQAIKKYAEKKLSKVKLDEGAYVTVSYGKEGHGFYVSFSYGDHYYTKKDEDMYKAIDLLSDVVKNKLRSNHNHVKMVRYMS